MGCDAASELSATEPKEGAEQESVTAQRTSQVGNRVTGEVERVQRQERVGGTEAEASRRIACADGNEAGVAPIG